MLRLRDRMDEVRAALERVEAESGALLEAAMPRRPNAEEKARAPGRRLEPQSPRGQVEAVRSQPRTPFGQPVRWAPPPRDHSQQNQPFHVPGVPRARART